MEDISKENECVLEVLNDAKPRRSRQNCNNDQFVRVHVDNEGVTVQYSSKRGRRSHRQSGKRQNDQTSQQINAGNPSNLDDISVSACKAPKLDIRPERQPSKFDTGYLGQHNLGNQRGNRNSGNWGSRSKNWKKHRIRQYDNRDRRTTKYTSSNYYNYASSNYNRRDNRQSTQNARLRNETGMVINVPEERESSTGWFMKMLDCLFSCFCGMFR